MRKSKFFFSETFLIFSRFNGKDAKFEYWLRLNLKILIFQQFLIN